MSVDKNHRLLLKRLKRQLRLLQHKEERSRQRLKAAMKKIRIMSKSYKSRLASNIRIMKSKIGHVKASTYAQIADEIQRQMLKEIASKGKSLSTAISKMEKKQIAKLTKGIVKKGKRKVKPKRSKLVKKKKSSRKGN